MQGQEQPLKKELLRKMPYMLKKDLSSSTKKHNSQEHRKEMS
jgi:hypothetical protein